MLFLSSRGLKKDRQFVRVVSRTAVHMNGVAVMLLSDCRSERYCRVFSAGSPSRPAETHGEGRVEGHPEG